MGRPAHDHHGSRVAQDMAKPRTEVQLVSSFSYDAMVSTVAIAAFRAHASSGTACTPDSAGHAVGHAVAEALRDVKWALHANTCWYSMSAADEVAAVQNQTCSSFIGDHTASEDPETGRISPDAVLVRPGHLQYSDESDLPRVQLENVPEDCPTTLGCQIHGRGDSNAHSTDEEKAKQSLNLKIKERLRSAIADIKADLLPEGFDMAFVSKLAASWPNGTQCLEEVLVEEEAPIERNECNN